jgi:hypothetical protein
MKSRYLLGLLALVAAQAGVALQLNLTAPDPVTQQTTTTCYLLQDGGTIDGTANIMALTAASVLPPQQCASGGPGPGTVQLNKASATVTAGDPPASFTTTRTGNTDEVEASLTVAGLAAGDALTGDCGLLSWTVADRSGAPKVCTVQAARNPSPAPTRTVTLTLSNVIDISNAGNTALGTPSQATLTILDNNQPPPGPCGPPPAGVVLSQLNWAARGSNNIVTWKSGTQYALQFTTSSDSARKGDVVFGTTTGVASATTTMSISACPGGAPLASTCTRTGLQGAIYYAQGTPLSYQCGLQPGTPYFLNLGSTNCPAGATCGNVVVVY